MSQRNVEIYQNIALTPRTPRRFDDNFDIPIFATEPTDSSTEPLLRSTSRRVNNNDPTASTYWEGVLKSFFDKLTLAVTSLMISILVLLLIRAFGPGEADYLFAQQADLLKSKIEPFPDDYTLISYENYTQFPLMPSEYRAECWKLHTGPMTHYGYWVDAKKDVRHLIHGESCTSTVTYMLGGGVGLMADLALMAQTAALARERNKTFFVDDTYWNRGKWSDYFEDVHQFQPGPEPGCRPPSPNELVACPRTAKHWVVNSQTSRFHFGHSFSDNYENPYARSLPRLKPIYEQGREFFLTTLQPNTELRDLIQLTRVEFDEPTYMGVHIRQGDRLGQSWKYHNSHLPVEHYATAANETWDRLLLSEKRSGPAVYLASDSPSALEDFTQYSSPSARIFSLSTSEYDALRSLASPQPYVQSEFDEFSYERRLNLTKGMIVDFALLSGLWAPSEKDIRSSAVVCGLSTNVCRVAALGFGWSGAFGDLEDDIDEETKRWVEIDNAGSIIPIWEAMEVFP